MTSPVIFLPKCEIHTLIFSISLAVLSLAVVLFYSPFVFVLFFFSWAIPPKPARTNTLVSPMIQIVILLQAAVLFASPFLVDVSKIILTSFFATFSLTSQTFSGSFSRRKSPSRVVFSPTPMDSSRPSSLSLGGRQR